MEIGLLFALLLITNLIYGVYSSVFTINNHCLFPIWPATLTSSGSTIISGFELQPQASQTIDIPGPWSGRVWARFQCSNNGKFSCRSADCGTGQIECNNAGGAPPATLAEFTLAPPGQQDFYDVSLVDGFNLPVSVASQGCAATDCPVDINAQCLGDVAVKDAAGATIGCKSACVAFNKPEFCCTGDFRLPDKCKPTNYSMFFKKLCPKAYSYAYDDKTSTFTCNSGANYLITFCP